MLIKKKKVHKWKSQSDINQKRKHDLQWKKQLVKQISETGVKVEIIIKEKNLWARLPKALKEVEEFKYQRSWDGRKLDFKKHY